MGVSTILLFGTLTIRLSSSLILVVLRPISSTKPSISPIFIRSPIRSTLSINMVIPPIMLLTVSCAANANVTPPMPRVVSNAAMSMLSIFKDHIIPKSQSSVDTAFLAVLITLMSIVLFPLFFSADRVYIRSSRESAKEARNHTMLRTNTTMYPRATLSLYGSTNGSF